MQGNASVVIVSTTTTTDDYGNTVTETIETPWSGCAVAPRSSNERTDPRSPAVLVGLTIYGPPTVAIDADDMLRIEDGFYAGLWQVDGDPGDWSSPFTDWHPGLEVAVKRAGSV